MKKNNFLLKLTTPLFCLFTILLLNCTAVSARDLTPAEKEKCLLDVWGNPVDTQQTYKVANREYPRRGIKIESSWGVDYGKIEWSDAKYTLPTQPMTGIILKFHKQPWKPNYDAEGISLPGSRYVRYEAIINSGDKVTIENPNREFNGFFTPSKEWTCFAADTNASLSQQFELGSINGNRQSISFKNMKTNSYLWTEDTSWLRSDGTNLNDSVAQWVLVPVTDSGELLDSNGNVFQPQF